MLPHTTLKLKGLSGSLHFTEEHKLLFCALLKLNFYAAGSSTSFSRAKRLILFTSSFVYCIILIQADILYYIIIAVGLAMVQKVKLMKNRQLSLASELDRVNRASTQSAVRLQEIGPRMTLHLVKV
ncbi:unnamed protein product [Musa hybrid cultivar]